MAERTIVLAVSGGPDSMALMWAAASSAFPRTHFHAVTVDHCLRAESAAEARFVGAVASRLGVPHTIRRWNGEKPSGNRQARARQARYDLLIAVARELGAAAIMTAHHQDDQVETHLLAQARQAGDRGLAGMRSIRQLAPDLPVLRPFLGVPGAILKASALHLDPVEDPSNHDARYHRIRLRQMLAAEGVDRAQVLRDIDRHRHVRDEADARLGGLVGQLLAERNLAVDDAGTLRLGATAFSAADPVLATELLARILPAVGGAPYAPLRAATERLRTRLLSGGEAVHTLGGVRVAAGRDITFTREFGREGPVSLPIRPGDGSTVFDGRFDLAWTPVPAAAQLVALGQLGRGNAAQRCLPVLVTPHGEVLAVHSALASKYGGKVPLMTSRERVSWRLCVDLPIGDSGVQAGPTGFADPLH